MITQSPWFPMALPPRTASSAVCIMLAREEKGREGKGGRGEGKEREIEER
jgi:hypothetical protein